MNEPYANHARRVSKYPTDVEIVFLRDLPADLRFRSGWGEQGLIGTTCAATVHGVRVLITAVSGKSYEDTLDQIQEMATHLKRTPLMEWPTLPEITMHKVVIDHT
jgi:hypothetical protein